MRDKLGLEAGQQICHVERGKGTSPMAAAERQHEMIEGSEALESLLHRGGISGIDSDRSDLAGKMVSGCLELRLVAGSDGDLKPLFEKQFGRGKADARRATDNDCMLQ